MVLVMTVASVVLAVALAGIVRVVLWGLAEEKVEVKVVAPAGAVGVATPRTGLMLRDELMWSGIGCIPTVDPEDLSMGTMDGTHRQMRHGRPGVTMRTGLGEDEVDIPIITVIGSG